MVESKPADTTRVEDEDCQVPLYESQEVDGPVQRNANVPAPAQMSSIGIFEPEEGEKSDRMGFIRKVYGILSVQLLGTAFAITAV